MRHVLIIFLGLLPYFGVAQASLQDSIYQDYISSVQFRILGLELSTPIVDLDGQLHLSFDDLDGDNKTFYYKLIHCNKDWFPSEDLTELDYIDGFMQDEIQNFEFSVNTLQPYTHYELLLPNENMKWTLSGNYILKVFTNEGEEEPVLTRRFIVVDSKVRILSEVTKAFGSGQMRSHQEVDFTIDHKGFPINNPKQFVSVSVMQNGVWGTTKSNIKPLFIRSEKLEYDYQGKITFPAMDEFRYLDIRSLRFSSERVQSIERNNDGTDIFVIPEIKRNEITYLSRRDMNGNFIVETFESEQDNTEGDYAMVYFKLPQKYDYEDGNLYLFGKFTDWKISEKYKMRYSTEDKAYTCAAYLKQGFYEYQIAFVPRGKSEINFDEIEGNKIETENNYTIIIYYRPFGGRYDQVIGVNTVSSVEE